MNKSIKLLFLLGSPLMCNLANAASLNVTSDVNLSSDTTYSGNTNGIQTSTSNSTSNSISPFNPWQLTTSGDILLTDNSYGVRVYNNGQLAITGQTGTERLLINGTTGTYIAGLYVNANGALTINNMNIEYSGNQLTVNSGNNLAVYNNGSMSLLGSEQGSHSLKITDNVSAQHTVFGVLNEGGQLISDNMSIDFSNNTASDKIMTITNGSTSSISGGKVVINGVTSGLNSIQIKDNVSTNASIRGITNNSNTGEIYIINMDIEYSGNNANTENYAFQNNNVLNIVGSASRNNLIIRNNSGSAGQVLGFFTQNGTTTVENMNIYSNGDYFSVVQNSNFNLDNSSVYIEDDSRGFVNNSGTSTVTVANSEFFGTGGLLQVFGSATLNLDVENSYVRGRAETAAGSVSNMALDKSIWEMRDSSVLTSLNNDGSQVDMRSVRSGVFNTLTMTNYVGNNGYIWMNAELGDESSQSDKIIINNGSASGNTILNIVSVGGNGNQSAGDGIKIVDAQGSSTIDSDAFVLNGGKVDNGFYEYELVQGDISGSDTQSLFLRSNGNISDTAKTIANEPAIIDSVSKVAMENVNRRIEDYQQGQLDGLWTKTYASSIKVDDMIATKFDVYGIDLGYDRRFDSENYQVYLGGVVGYQYINNLKTQQTNGARDGDGSGNIPSVGVYAALLHENGWYFDAAIRHFKSNFTLTSYAANGTAVDYKPGRTMTVYSAGVGKTFDSCSDCSESFVIEPRAQFSYMNANSKNVTTNLGNAIRYHNTDVYTGRASVTVGYNKTLDNNMVAKPYLRTGVNHAMNAKTDIVYDGSKYKSDLKGTNWEGGAGLNVKINDSSSFYSEFMYEKGSVIKHKTSGYIGVNYRW